MQALATSLGLVVILITATFAYMQHFKDERLLSIAIKDSFNEQFREIRSALSDAKDKEMRSFRNIHAAHTKPDKKQQKETNKRLSQFLNIAPLFEDYTNATNERTEATKILFSRLLNALYQDQDFYIRAKEQYPDLENILIEKLSSMLKEKKIASKNKNVKTSDIKKLTFDDPTLNDIIYRMLCGSRPASDDASTLVSYHSFCDFIKISESLSSVCVWLAPKPVLFAVFQNEKIVEEIVEYRKQIHRTLENDKDIKNQVSKEFEQAFKQYIPQDIKSLQVTFAISMTTPKE